MVHLLSGAGPVSASRQFLSEAFRESQIANRNYHLLVMSALCVTSNILRSKWCAHAIWLNPHPDFFLKNGDSKLVSGFHHTRHPHVRPRSSSNATSQMSTPGLEAEGRWTKLVDRSVIESEWIYIFYIYCIWLYNIYIPRWWVLSKWYLWI